MRRLGGTTALAVAVAALSASVGIARAAVGANAPPYLSPTPSKHVTVVVLISEEGIKASKFRQLGTGNESSMEVVKGPLERGDVVTFNIVNRGTNVHDFMIFGKKTARISPGRTAHLYFKLQGAGRFVYRSTLDDEPAFRGYLAVV